LEEEVGVKHYEAPAFGLHYACQEDVFEFYDFWKGFSTSK
jgi:DnaJ homolog subfamily A member 5